MPYSLFNTLTISRQDMLTRLTDLDVTSNNLANINTAGFKANRSNFQEMLNQQPTAQRRLPNTSQYATASASTRRPLVAS